MNNYKVIKNFDVNGKRLEELLLDYFSIYLDSDNYE